MNQDRAGGAAELIGQLSQTEKRSLLKDLLRARRGAEDQERIPRRSLPGPWPLSFAQQRLWVVDRLEPDSAAYNLPYALRLRGTLDVAALRAGLDALVARHETLRTVFAEQGGSPVQVVHPAAPVRLVELDVRGLPEAEREAEAARLAAEEALRPFDLARGPLLRCTLLRLADTEHVLCFTMHHIVSDGWSRRVLVREISALYAAFSGGEEPRLPEMPVQYADFAVWQRERLGGPVLEDQLRFWRDALDGAPPLLDLPTDRPRVADGSPRGAVRSFAIPARVAEGLRELSRREGATLFMTVLAGWQALLRAYSGQEDVVVGTTVAGRARVETEGLIGFFVNMLPLRVDLSGDLTWAALLGRVREAALGAYSHQEVPFERLVEALSVERSLAHTPIFQVTFDLESAAAGDSLALGALAAEPFETGVVAAKFDMELSLRDGGDALLGSLLYRADLFEADTAAGMVAQLETVLEAMAADPARRVSELSLLRGDERARVLHAWNATAQDFPDDLCLHELVAAQARRTPGAPALVFEGRPLAYAELDAGANRLAQLLRRRGVGPEARVAISLEKGPEMALAVLGVLKAGGAYVPVDPAYPAERLAYVLADSGAALLLTQARLADRFAASGVPVLALDALGAELDDAPDQAPGSGVAPDNLAYVIYTSGSTGQPKGVGVPHRAVVNLATDMAVRLRLRPDDRLLQFASLSFDVSVEEIFTAWTAGAAVVLSRGELFAPGELRRTVERERITSFELPSAFWAEWTRELREGGLGVPESVRFVRVGGERVAPERLREWARLGVPLLHVYGVTEATCTSAALWVEPGEDAGERASLPIGSPTGNVRLYVLDGSGEPVPVGVPGELCVGGVQVARGYLDRPELTAEKFVPDALSGEGGTRLYRTGDRARWLASGEMELLGRIDAQVKLRGFRIEPGEIEAVLRGHPRVREAVVAVREDAAFGVPGEKRLVAYVVPVAAEAPLAAELKALLRERLPEYMVPAALVELDELPLSVSGKVDRRALPAPAYGSAEDRYVAPRTATEEVLAGIWAEVLGAERIGVEESFFALGGHSLLATQVVSRARQAFGVEVPLRAFFEAPTVAGLAGRVEALRGAGAGVAPPIVRVPRAEPLPLSFAQQRLWLVDRMEPGSAAYNMPGALRLRGPLDLAALRAGLDALVARHETLRTTFAEGEDGPVQVVHAPAPAALSVLDLQGVPDAEREAERLAAEEALRPFDLARGPLLRCTLLRLADDDHVLCLTMHHVVSDGWSMRVLVREISALYDAFSRGEEPRLPELPVQYADFAVWQRERLCGETLEARVGFWKEKLAGAPALLEIPTDRPREPGQSPLAASHPFRLSPELSRELRALSRREGTTLFMTVLAAWQSLLARGSGQDDVVVGSPVAGRDRHEVEGLIGFFVNMLPLRADMGGDPAWSELLRRTRDTALDAYDHQELPFERLVEELGVQRSPLHSPVFQAAFTLEPAAGGDERREAGFVHLEPFGGGERVAKFDLFLAMADDGEALDGTLVYRRALFEPETIARMAGHLEAVLEAMSADPASRLSDLSLLRGAERARVLEAWNATAAELPRACVHELFAGQAAHTPAAVAIVAGEETVTYTELERRANRLAHLLRGRGAGPESRVGVCLERGIPAVLAILATLKAGAAYVPVAPADPAERLREVFADAGVRLVLSESAVGAQLPDSVEPLWLDAPETAAGLLAMPETAPEVPSDPAQLAYVIYTSGSTGRPKGVAVAHQSVVRLVRNTSYVPFGPEERIAHVSNLAFDAATFELWGALLNGGSLAVVEREVLLSPAAFAAELRRTQATAMFLTAALFNRIAHEEPDAFATCRHVLVGGEAVDAQSMRRVQEAGGPLRLLNGYGPTEATTFAAWHEVGPVEPGARTVPIGRPLGNTTLYVLDAGGEALPVGAPGELHIGGLALARGYLGQPGMTADRFVPDAFGAEGGRLYRTGDRVRWTAAGEVEYLGRMDQQVKVRGFRIEPAEVEAVLLAHDAVREAIVAVREDVPGDKRLVAYVVPAEGAQPGAAELRARLAARLPEHMVPGAFVVLESIPLTANGKVDRGALPAPALDAAAHVPPRTPAEEVLAGIWGEVLGLERVGVTASFFELGGHSLLATQVVSRARHAFGVEVPLRTLFEAPTVAELAAAVEALRGAGGVAAPPMERVSRTGPLPLSFAQQRLWLMDRMEPGSPAYNMPFPLRLRGALDVGALRASLDALVERHETLRTTFAERDAGPVQIIHRPAPVQLAEMDLRELPEAEREPAAERLADDDAIRPFDLARGPLLRSTLLRLGEEDHVLFLTLHHVASDGWSMQVMVREVSALYNAFSRGEEAHLPELPVQYADFAVWQRAWMSGEVLEAQLAYWRERLADAPPLLEIPTDRPRAAGRSALAGARSITLSPGLSGRLRTLSHREGATLFMTTLAAWQVLLGRYAGQDDVVVGTPIAGRNRRETEGLIGFFVNMLPLRADLSGDATWAELLGRVRATALGAYDHQDLPFERLVDELGVERSLTHSPVFQAVFTLNRAGKADGPSPAGGLELEPFGAGAGIAKYDLDLVLADAGEALAGAIVYRDALFEPATIARMVEHLEALLEGMASEPGRRLSEMSLLRGGELAQVLHAWSATRAEDPGPCLHERFAAQAARTPLATAVVFEDRSLSYAQLHAGADRLARHLRARGVHAETRVALCAERSPELIVGILGILAAGGVYVPVDPVYPADRIAYLLEDSGCAAVLVQAPLRSRIPPAAAQVLTLEDALADEAPDEGAPAAVRPDNAAYVIYTSGSTGRPKGVVVTHANVARLFQATDPWFGFGAQDVWTLFHSYAFDFSVWEIWGALLHGGRLVVVPWETSRSPEQFHDLLVREGVTVLSQTPSAFRQLDAVEQARGVSPGLALRLVVFGGEALEPRTLRGWLERHGAERPRLVNMYGITETTVHVTYRPLGWEEVESAGASPIGTAIPDLGVRVLDGWGHPVPVGVPGELYVGGGGVARGYLGRAELTAERFVPDAYSAEPGARVYRTGDRVRWLASGELEYLGRMDRQVKIRGFRIEPGEVEAALAGLGGVREAVVVVREDVPGEKRLVAYVVPAEAGGVTGAGLREELGSRLPEHMVPGAFVVLEQLPLTSHGKVDRRALPAPQLGAETVYAAPRTEIEEMLCTIWLEVLTISGETRVERVGIHDNFFLIGGHSLLATQVIARIREVFGIEVLMQSLFGSPTVAGLAEVVEQQLILGADAAELEEELSRLEPVSGTDAVT